MQYKDVQFKMRRFCVENSTHMSVDGIRALIPSEEWARIRVYGEAFNAALRRHVAERLTAAGHPAVAPMLVPNWTIVNSQRPTDSKGMDAGCARSACPARPAFR
jgi:hypothetical protein